MTQHYLEQRAPGLLAYGRIHEESGHVHYHLMMSTNEEGENGRFRLSKYDFLGIQRECEHWLDRTYPELKIQFVYNLARDHQPGQVKDHRRHPTTEEEREVTRERLAAIFVEDADSIPVEQRLANAGFHLYLRGKNSHGVIGPDGKKYRFKTLGLLDAFEEVRESEEKFQEAKAQIQAARGHAEAAHGKDDQFDFSLTMDD